MLRGACLLSVVLAGGIGGAQSRPDFSGTWLPVEGPATAPAPPPLPPASPGGRPAPPPPPPPRTLSTMIVQSPAEMTVRRRVETGGREAMYTFTYRLDGTESVNQMGAIVSKTTASWDGATLVLSSTFSADGKMMGSGRELYHIENGQLIVESTRETPAGKFTERTVHKKRFEDNPARQQHSYRRGPRANGASSEVHKREPPIGSAFASLRKVGGPIDQWTTTSSSTWLALEPVPGAADRHDLNAVQIGSGSQPRGINGGIDHSRFNVDDHPTGRLSTAGFLVRDDHQIIPAEFGDRALQNPARLVVLPFVENDIELAFANEETVWTSDGPTVVPEEIDVTGGESDDRRNNDADWRSSARAHSSSDHSCLAPTQGIHALVGCGPKNSAKFDASRRVRIDTPPLSTTTLTRPSQFPQRLCESSLSKFRR
jgi:hypothetical protein